MKVRLFAASAIAALALTACNGADPDSEAEQVDSQATEQVSAEDKALASLNYTPGAKDDFEAPEHMLLQVTLDSLGFSPGVVDGKMNQATKNALMALQEAEGLDATGEYDADTQQTLSNRMLESATRVVTIPPSWANMKYEKLPEAPPEQAKLDTLGYESLWERLAERFHTTEDILYGLNPDLCSPEARPKPDTTGEDGDTPVSSDQLSTDTAQSYQALTECKFDGSLANHKLRVPNISDRQIDPQAMDDAGWADTLASLGVMKEQPEADKIVVDKSDGMLRVFGDNERLIAAYTVTTGSSNDPLPLGDWKINGISKNPEFSYDPELFWDVPDSEQDQLLPPGPNGPVGVVWIDLSKEHYGIHGTSAPATIGTAQSHGCVRLTNWDAAELAQMVDSSTDVVFQA